MKRGKNVLQFPYNKANKNYRFRTHSYFWNEINVHDQLNLKSELKLFAHIKNEIIPYDFGYMQYHLEGTVPLMCITTSYDHKLFRNFGSMFTSIRENRSKSVDEYQITFTGSFAEFLES